MDPEKLQRLVQVVQKMNAEGIPAAQIRQSLLAMGLNDNDITAVFARAQLQPTPAEIHTAVRAVEEKIATGEHLAPVAESIEEQKQISQSIDQRIAKLAKRVDELYFIKDDIREIKEILLEIKPMLKIIRETNQKLLDAINSLLTRL